MKVVYIFESANSALLLERMIIPQLGKGEHGAEVVGMFFLAETVFFFLPEHPVGEALTALAAKLNFFIVCCDFCCEQRKISGRLYPGAREGCFPDLYRLAAERGAEQVITL